MGKPLKELSRRDFLKLTGVSALGGTLMALLEACGIEFPSPKELRQEKFSKEAIIFNGKTISFDFLDTKVKTHVEKTKFIISGMKDHKIGYNNPEGYKGNPLPDNWEIDYDRTAIIVNTTESGDLISQVYLSRKKVNKDQEDGKYGLKEPRNDLASGLVYSEHSLVVVGPESYYYFDNVESKTDQGRTRITVDGKTGKIYQITQNSPNPLKKLFKKEEVSMTIEEIDVLKNERAFQTTFTPIHPGFINYLNMFIQNLRPDLNSEEKMEAVSLFLSGSRLTWYDEDKLKKYLFSPNYVNIDILKRFNFDIPFDEVELPIIHSVLSKKIRQFIEAIKENKIDFDGDVSISINAHLTDIPELNDNNIKTLKKLLEERVSLPMSVPELYLLKTENNKGERKWFLVGRYQVRENDVDETTLTSKPNAYSLGENWYIFGDVNEKEIVESASLRPFEIQIKDFPYDNLIKEENINNPLVSKSIFGLINIPEEKKILEARIIDPEAIKFVWNPEERKIKPALIVIDRNNRPRAIVLSYDRFSRNQIDKLPFMSNRIWLLGFGYSPTVLKDVTEHVSDLISKGYQTTSLFLLDPMADFSLIANFTSESGGFLDYSTLQNEFSPKAFENFVQPGEFLKGGADNSMLVMPKPGAEKTIIYKYDKRTKEKVGEVEIDHPILISPKKIGTFLDNTNYIVVTEDDNFSYIVEIENTFPLGARSTEKLVAIAMSEFAAVIATIYGGYRLIGKIPLLKKFLEETFKKIGESIITSL